MANWFECKAQYDKMMENGSTKKVTEPYMVDVLARITKSTSSAFITDSP